MVVDLAELLYTRTGGERYQDFALDLARRHTVILPMYSWAYFVVARYSESGVERVSAAASGLKLDPLSYRASQLPESVVERARSFLEKYGAPYPTRSEGPSNLGT